ncbi:MAG: DNA mismatch repair endonuclease MutL [Phycisphaerae bacterium]
MNAVFCTGMNVQLSDPASRPAIAVLPDSLINKIAAGEVVERPASVIKELVENSIDADATRIAVVVQDGGRTLMRVTDNGCGMSEEDARLAFARHATSKIRDVDDLFSIQTLGFRGEALASVAGVSHATLITRRPTDAGGIRLDASESVIGEPIPCAAAVGTTIEVQDLFYCVPARRKFLRSDATEFGHIHDMVLRSALAQPDIAFTLEHNGRKVLELPAVSDTAERIAAAIDKDLRGRLLPIHHEDATARITGFIGVPETARGTNRHQFIFLNGRYIRDRSMLHAMKEAYRGLIDPHQHPVAILYVEMDPAAFDVNVHPQKTEVRFRDANIPFRMVLGALRQKLLQTDLTPPASLKPDSASAPAPPARTPAAARKSSLDETRQVLAEFFRQPPIQPQPALPLRGIGEPPSIVPATAPSTDASLPPVTLPAPSAEEELTGREPMPPIVAPVLNIKCIQLHNRYILAEDDQGIVLIDQHALHERILYEELLSRVRKGPLESQRLLLPVMVEVNERQAGNLERVRPTLEKLGIEINRFDAQSVAVQGLPPLLARLDAGAFIRLLLDYLDEADCNIGDEALLHEILDMASCKAAIKAGDPLSATEIDALLIRRHEIERSSNCPHGRPTTVRLSFAQLEKQFKRR